MKRESVIVRAGRGGFTLLEMLLAVGVCAVVLAAVNAAFFAGVRMRDSVTRLLDTARPVEQALAVLRRDLQGVVLNPSTNRVFGGEFRTGNLDGLQPGNDQQLVMELYTTTGALHANEPWAEVQQVTYGLRAAATGSVGRALIRSVTRNLLAVMPAPPVEQTLLDNVAALECECYDGTQWRADWDTTQTDSDTANLPAAVRVRIRLAAGPEPAGAPDAPPLELIVPFGLPATSTNLTVVAGGT